MTEREYVTFGKLREAEKRKEVAAPVVESGIPKSDTVPERHTAPVRIDTVPKSGMVESGMPFVGTVEGYTAIPNAILDELLGTLGPSEQLIFLRIYRLTAGFGRERCEVGYITLGRAVHLGRSAVVEAIERLIRRGLIVRESAGAGKAASVYRLAPLTVPESGMPKRGIPKSGVAKSGMPTSEPVKALPEKKEMKAASPLDKFEVRKIVARIHEVFPEYGPERLRDATRSALIGQGYEVDETVLDAALTH